MTRLLLAAALVAVAGVTWARGIDMPPSLPLAPEPKPDSFIGYARPVDGDTLEVGGIRVRLAAIDAPERNQTCQGRDGSTYECGRDASATLASLVRGRIVTCTPRDRDRYGRTVATCEADGKDLGGEMVRLGWAVDYRGYDRECRYCAVEAEAKAAGRGIWAGRFTTPAEWRREHRR